MSLRQKFLKFVLPSIASMWVFSFYTIVDGVFVARGVGEVAMSAVNLSMPFTSFVFMIGILLATGTSTVISIALGRGNLDEANHYFNQNIIVTACVTLILSVFVLFSLNHVVTFLGATAETFGYMKEYVGIIAIFAVFFTVSYNLEVQVKANGAPHISVIGVLSCGIMNVFLDAFFVLGLNWGVSGAALATGLSQVVSTFIFIFYFIFRSKVLQFKRVQLDLRVYPRIIFLGLSEGFNELSNGLVIFLFNHTILRVIGERGLPAYTIISYVNTIVLMTMNGTAQGIEPLISYSYGAKRDWECNRLLKYALVAVTCFSILFFLLGEFQAPFLVSIFLDANSELFIYSIGALKLYSWAFLLIGFNVIFVGYFTAVEKPQYAFMISFGRSFLFLVGSLLVLSSIYQETGIWISAFVSELLCLFVSGSCVFYHFIYHKKEREQ